MLKKNDLDSKVSKSACSKRKKRASRRLLSSIKDLVSRPPLILFETFGYKACLRLQYWRYFDAEEDYQTSLVDLN
jgi:hypothetical protein